MGVSYGGIPSGAVEKAQGREVYALSAIQGRMALVHLALHMKGGRELEIGENQKCFQCQTFKPEVLSLGEGVDGFSVCEPCLNLFLNGEIKFVDAHDVTE